MRSSTVISEISISEEAFGVIEQGLRQAQEESLELGGSLLAYEKDGRALVAYALPTGPRAHRGPGYLRTDAAFQNDAIRRVRAFWPALAYAGDWHIHPMFLPELSGTDRATARAILGDEDTRRDRLLLVLATSRRDGPPVVLGFVATIVQGAKLQIDKVPIVPVASDAPEVLAALGRPLPPLSDVLSGKEGSRPSDVEITTGPDVATARIIEDDLADVRASLGAEAHLWRDEELLGAVIRRGKREVHVVFPPEYPLGAPQVYAGEAGDDEHLPVPLPFGWSSLHRLADPVQTALAEPMRSEAPRAGVVEDAWPWVAVSALLRWMGLRRLAALVSPAIVASEKRAEVFS